MKYIRYSIGKTYLKALSEKTKKMPKILFYAFVRWRYPKSKYDYKNTMGTVIISLKKDLTKFAYDPSNLQALTPIETQSRYDMYIETFEEIYSNDNFLNIGISGIYGSGKSTLIKAIRSKSFIGNNFSISLADFKDEGILKKDLPKSRLDMIEIKILRQLYYQSNFKQTKVLRTTNWQEITKFELVKNFFQFSILTIIFIYYIDLWKWLWPDQTVFTIDRMPGRLLNALNSEVLQEEAILIVILTILAITYCWYLIRKYYLKIRFGIKADKINIEMESEKDNISAISEGKYLHELMYLLKYNNIDTVFIEDLDRFDNTDILAGLKEINFLINSYNYKRHFFPVWYTLKKIFRRVPVKNRKIRFIYAIRDDVFIDSDRLKFFDIIVPIIPITNSSNSYLRLNSALAQNMPNELLNRLDMELVKDICNSIWDMRMVNEIANEFSIFLAEKLKNMNAEEIDINLIFCLIVLKVKYPLEYKQLSQNKGLCFERIHNPSFSALQFILTCDEVERDRLHEVNELLELFIKRGYLNLKYLEYMTYAKIDTLDESDQAFYKMSREEELNLENATDKMTYSIHNASNFISFIKEENIVDTHLWHPELIFKVSKEIDLGKDTNRNEKILEVMIKNMHKDIPYLSANMVFKSLITSCSDKNILISIFHRLVKTDSSKEIFSDILEYSLQNEDFELLDSKKIELFETFLKELDTTSIKSYKEESKQILQFVFATSWQHIFPNLASVYLDKLCALTKELNILYEIKHIPDASQPEYEFFKYIIENSYYGPNLVNIQLVLQSILGDEYRENESVITNFNKNKNNQEVRKSYNFVLDHDDEFIKSSIDVEKIDEDYVVWLLEHSQNQDDSVIDEVLQMYNHPFRIRINDTKINAVWCLKCIENGNYPSNIDSYLDLFDQPRGTDDPNYLDSKIAQSINKLGLDKNEKLSYDNIGLLLRNNDIRIDFYREIVVNLSSDDHKITILKGTILDDDKLELLIRKNMLIFDRNSLDMLIHKRRLLNIYLMIAVREFTDQEKMIIEELHNDYVTSICEQSLKLRIPPSFEVSDDRIEVRELEHS
ncbi:hypothetical protein MKC90_10750 [[Clostridium] innocuum]|nr:hypothetical protein [[Clostridium] innocuum]